jgi:hypothetical protein
MMHTHLVQEEANQVLKRRAAEQEEQLEVLI